MLDANLAQVVIVAVVAAAFIALTVGIVALITILRRRRMADHNTIAAVPTTTVIVSPSTPVPTSETPAHTEAPVVTPEKSIVESIALDPSELDSLTIKPDEGPTKREQDVHRLIAHLKSDSETPDELPAS
jgi:hypothetical protein